MRNRVCKRYQRVWQCPTAIIVMLAFLHIPVLQAQQAKVSEYQVKATYLYNFGRFVQWPLNASAAKGDSFSICVIGQDPFGTALDGILSGETIDGMAVVAKRVVKPQDAVNCRVLYISLSEDGRLKELLAALDKAGVLTVSDIPQFSQRGGMIQFVVVGNKIRFEVNLTSAQDAGLTLSSDLLKVAATVRKTSQPGD
jgi:YfiR/HmsC-like